MRTGLRSTLALIFVVFSLLYIVFAVSVDQNRMIGDQEGWDPGSRAVPVALGVLMLVLSIYIFTREQREPPEEPSDTRDAGARKLVVLALVVCLFYVLLFRIIGFILVTATLLFTLSFFSRKGDLLFRDIPVYGLGLFAAVSFTLLVYTAGRLATRWMFYFGRQLSIPLLGNNLFRAGAAMLIAAGLIAAMLVLSRGLKKSERWKDVRNVLVVTTATTEILYLVFKQIFTVDLVGGLVFW